MYEILIIRQPKTNVEFESMYDLRWRVLREPWNQPKGSEKDSEEANAIPFIALLNDVIIGTARYHGINDHVGQVRYLAIDPNYQRKGVGRSLMEAIHVSARSRVKYLILNARETAVKFFEKLGYQIIGDGPLLFGTIKHKKMAFRFGRETSQVQNLIENLKKTVNL